MNLLKVLFNLNNIIGIISIDHTLFGYKYDDNNDLLGVAKMSQPIAKDPTKEALFRIKLDF